MAKAESSGSGKSRLRRRARIALLVVVGLLIVIPLGARIWVARAANARVYSSASQVPPCRVAMVLGARVLPNGMLCPFLRERCDVAIDLYKSGKVQKLLMSGDNRFKDYNEPEAMRNYAIAHGVPVGDIALDYAGRRTFDSMYRARHIFGIDKMIVVTQAFHTPRAVFLARAVGVDAYGVNAPGDYVFKSDVRECFACVSALLDVYVFSPKPILGRKEKI